ncbi:hypothetical protein [Enhydrobacter aerosaccus]|uniref:hypothetical protein n=1 Tax=Enhydrobacter aerosaccus TaxID=225324 RepID=UPI00111759F8|nr:hypothetical protein [Enhydrobacter aerosaccus]
MNKNPRRFRAVIRVPARIAPHASKIEGTAPKVPSVNDVVLSIAWQEMTPRLANGSVDTLKVISRSTLDHRGSQGKGYLRVHAAETHEILAGRSRF